MKLTEDHKHLIIVGLLALATAVAIIICTNAWGDSPIKDYPEIHHQELVSEILMLESSMGKNLYGQDGEYGVAQFKIKTFDWMKYKAGMPWLDFRDQYDQITLLSWALRNGYGRHWSTYKRAEQNVVIRRYK